MKTLTRDPDRWAGAVFGKARRLRRKAENVVAAAKIAANSGLVPLLDRIPTVDLMARTKGSNHWDFFATIAAVGAGMLYGYASIPDEDVPAVEQALRQALSAWDEQGYEAYLNFAGFVACNVDAQVATPVAIGAWVLWNLKGAQPTDEEMTAAPAIGGFLCGSMDKEWS
jgi:hypothetical protein